MTLRNRTTSYWLAILAIAALASIAAQAAPPPDDGIDCILIAPDGTIYAISRDSWAYLISKDGGSTWGEALNEDADEGLTCTCAPNVVAWEVVNPAEPLVKYRLTPGSTIERSGDGGKTWQLEKDLTLSNAQLKYYQAQMGGKAITPGPVEAAIHPQTGSLLVAMGFEGILIRSKEGHWRWQPFHSADSGAQRVNFASPGTVISAISLEIVLGFLAAFLLAGSLSMLAGDIGNLTLNWTGAAGLWGGWLVSHAAGSSLMGLSTVSMALAALLAILTVAWGVIGGMRIRAKLAALPPEVWIGGVAITMLYVIPFILWTQNIVQWRSTAILAGFVAVAVVNVAARVILLRRVRAVEDIEETNNAK